jgi:VanZ family protein
MALITFLSSRPGTTFPDWGWLRFDKLLHVLEYGGLGFLLCYAFDGLSAPARLAAATLLGIGFGVLDEFHQTFVPHRSGNDLGDMTADLVGSFAGALSFLVLTHLFAKRRHP